MQKNQKTETEVKIINLLSSILVGLVTGRIVRRYDAPKWAQVGFGYLAYLQVVHVDKKIT